MRKLSTFVAAAVLMIVLLACEGDRLSKDATPNATDVRPERSSYAPSYRRAPEGGGYCCNLLQTQLRDQTKNPPASCGRQRSVLRQRPLMPTSQPSCAATPPSPSTSIRP